MRLRVSESGLTRHPDQCFFGVVPVGFKFLVFKMSSNWVQLQMFVFTILLRKTGDEVHSFTDAFSVLKRLILHKSRSIVVGTQPYLLFRLQKLTES